VTLEESSDDGNEIIQPSGEGTDTFSQTLNI
jgi:hypothetical protein